jgi:hypothetical protein
MASEITITASLAATKSGATLSTSALSAVLDMTGNAVQVQTVTVDDSGDTEIPKAADIGTRGQTIIKNLDADYYVELAFEDETSGTFDDSRWCKIEPGAFVLVKPVLPSGATGIYARAESGQTVVLGVWQVEE